MAKRQKKEYEYSYYLYSKDVGYVEIFSTLEPEEIETESYFNSGWSVYIRVANSDELELLQHISGVVVNDIAEVSLFGFDALAPVGHFHLKEGT